MGTYRVNTKGIASGKSGNDLVYGDSKENILIGNGGNDSLWGRGGTDLIDGGSGNDKLYGETGDDLLNGGLGRDTLTGGAGRDVFTFETRPSNSSIDTITDFSVTYDTIGLTRRSSKASPRREPNRPTTSNRVLSGPGPRPTMQMTVSSTTRAPARSITIRTDRARRPRYNSRSSIKV